MNIREISHCSNFWNIGIDREIKIQFISDSIDSLDNVCAFK